MSKRTGKRVSATDTRRDFLKLAAVTGGAIAVTRLAGGAVAEEVAREETTSAIKKRGYHLTPHIRQYYEKAQF